MMKALTIPNGNIGTRIMASVPFIYETTAAPWEAAAIAAIAVSDAGSC
jgi:hypothetical protein